MKKRLISMLLCTAMVATMFAGCSSKKEEASSGEETSSGEEDTADGEPLEITWVVYNQPGIVPSQDTEIEQLLEEKYNIEITVEQVDIHDEEQMGLYWAGNNYPDVVSFTDASSSNISDLIAQGILRDIPEGYLDEYMPDYMEELYNQFGEETIKKLLDVDGKEYILPYRCADWPFLMGIRQDWLDNLGLSMPTNNEELFEVMKAFTFDDPDGNGVDDTYGIDVQNGVWGDVSLGYPMYATGIVPHSYLQQDDGSVVYAATTEVYKDALKMFASWYEAGVIDPEFTTDDRAAVRDKWANGKVGMVIDDCWWWCSSVESNLRSMVTDVNPDAEVSIMEPFAGEDGVKRLCWTYATVSRNGCMAFGSDCSDEIIQKVLEIKNDFVTDMDFYLRAFYGEEGVDYELVDGTVSILNDSSSPETITEKGTGATFAIIPDTDAMMGLSYSQEDVELRNWASSFDYAYAGENFVVNGTNQARNDYGSDVATIASEFYYNAISGQVDIDAEWDNYLGKMEQAGVQLICQEYEEMLNQ